jgi:hypothetical protein
VLINQTVMERTVTISAVASVPATRNIPNVDKQAKPAPSVTLSATTRGLAKTVILKVSANLG